MPNRDLIVSKYGGSSIASSEDIERIQQITSDDNRRKIIVPSAPGKRHDKDDKVTDLLIQLAGTKDERTAQKIIDRYREIYPGMDISELDKELNRRLNLDLPEDAYLALIKSFGEWGQAKLLAAKLSAEYVDPRELFLVGGSFENAQILLESKEMIKRKLESLDHLVVVPGFYGCTRNNETATFSRGGSDLTGSYIASTLDALLYENFTDQGGVLAADPKIVQYAKKIPELTFGEMRNLSLSGFTVMHPAAMEPVQESRTSVHIRNTRKYPQEGTYIVDDRITSSDESILGVVYNNGFCAFSIKRYGLNEEIGILWKIAKSFSDEGISIWFPPGGIDDLSFVVRQEHLKDDHVIGRIKNAVYNAVGEKAIIKFYDHLGCLAVVGKGLAGRKGISADIQKTIAEAGINIRFISQGIEEDSISYGIDEVEGPRGVKEVYDRFLRN